AELSARAALAGLGAALASGRSGCRASAGSLRLATRAARPAGLPGRSLELNQTVANRGRAERQRGVWYLENFIGFLRYDGDRRGHARVEGRALGRLNRAGDAVVHDVLRGRAN